MAYVTSLGPDATLLDVYRAYPALAAPVLALGEAAFTLTNQLSRGECELLGTYISSLNGCDYCRSIHGEATVVCGIDRSALPTADDHPAYGGPRWAPIFAYVHTLTLRPAQVEPSQLVALAQANWDDAVIVQLAAICAFFNVLNRLADGLGLTGDATFFAAAGQRIGTMSYGGTAALLGLLPANDRAE
jgi:uncharacterized peroxidase-related enzyme